MNKANTPAMPKNYEKAMQIAQAIVNDDTGSYLVALRDADMDSMKRGEVIEFRDLVHEIAEKLTPTKQIQVISHNQGAV
jgi:hypothetical protein